MMKYQKSMMKIMEFLFSSSDKKSVEEIIRGSKTGRSSSFKALDYLEEKGFIDVESIGNQKSIELVKDNFTFQFKYYLDSLEFKGLRPEIKLILNLFNLYISKFSKVKLGVLFGSVAVSSNFDDIDILLIGDNLKIGDLKKLSKIRKRLERFFGVVFNFHIADSNFNEISKGIVFYQSSYIFNLNEIQKQYIEFFESYCESVFTKSNELFEVSLINLAYVYCKLESVNARTKAEAKGCLLKKYKIKNFKELNKRGIEIGKEIFK